MKVIGIDGGATKVRVIITDPDHVVHSSVEDAAVNPKVVGEAVAAQRIQAAIARALAEAALQPSDIAAVGVGLAGASEVSAWSRDVVRAALPDATIAVAGDCEIALIGARGRRHGVVVLAGTGTVACGVNDAGAMAVAGGMGYILGDEGGGYWLGKEAVRRSIHAIDGVGPSTRLTEAVFGALALSSRAALVEWVYRVTRTEVAAIARLAPLVLREAAAGDAVAQEIVAEGARALARMGRAVMQRLGLGVEHLVFAGSLLTSPNPLSERLCALFGLPAIPTPRYPPAMGAALLALQAAGESAARQPEVPA